jgi:hypothetical protein
MTLPRPDHDRCAADDEMKPPTDENQNENCWTDLEADPEWCRNNHLSLFNGLSVFANGGMSRQRQRNQ